MHVCFDGFTWVDLQVLWQEDSDKSWKLIDQEKTDIVHENGKFFVRARIHHFSKGYLGTSVDMQNSYHQEDMRWLRWGKPGRREIEVLNATDKAIIILALPTGVSNRIASEFIGSLEGSGVTVSLEMRRVVEQAILSSAVSPQMFQLPIRNTTETTRAGTKCTFDYCSLSKWTTNEATVALVTSDDDKVEVWDYKIIQGGTRHAVLPGRFSQGMRPLLGTFRRCELSETPSELELALEALRRSVQRRQGINTVVSRVGTTSAVEAEPQDS